MTFFTDYNNLALIGLTVVSGGLLIWPSIQRRSAGQVVTAAEATQLINRRNAVVVDVRTADEFAAGHLPNAKHFPADGSDEKNQHALARNKETPIVVVCQSGAQSGRATTRLKQAGYSEVVYLEGGVAGWQQAGLPLVKGAGKTASGK